MEMQGDIRVLETRLDNLDKNLDVLSHKMDGLLHIQEQWIRLQEQHEKTRDGLDKALLLINTMSVLSQDTENRLNKALYAVRGAAAVGTLLFAFVQWYVLEQLESLEEMQGSIDKIDHRITVIEEQHKPWYARDAWPTLGPKNEE